MYFWRIELLKSELRRGSLSQRTAFAYVLASMLVYTISTAAPNVWSPKSEPVTSVVDWVVYAIMVLLVGGGTYAAYRANGGYAGSDFASRYFALGWVLFIRLVVLLFLPATVLLFAVGGALGPTQMEGEPADTHFDWAGTAAGVVFEAVYYWRLVRHFGAVAGVSHARTEDGSPPV